MTVVDLHPDDLLEREAQGALSPEQGARLAQHLARCGMCRLERQLRDDFEAELAPLAEATSLQRFVTGALLATQLPQEGNGLAQSNINRRSRLARPTAMIIAATMLFVAGLSAAQTELALRVVALARMGLGVDTKPPIATVPSAPRPHMRAAMPRGLGKATAQTEVSAGHVIAQTKPTPASVASPAVRVQRPLRRIRPAPSPTAPSPVLSPSAPIDAAGLFERANATRQRGQLREAIQVYRELCSNFADTQEARMSRFLMARLHLDLGDAPAALADFETYLTLPGGALREDALVGRALAARRLGDLEREQDSVRQLLRAYPASSYGLSARGRLSLE